MALQFEQETYKIIGASINVHKALGCGFLESIYQEALRLMLELSIILNLQIFLSVYL